jgi:osmotically-inducible protein OsmY
MVLLLAAVAAAGDERRNVFDDPFLAVSTGLATCPIPQEPLLTEQQARSESHSRAERGTSCYLSGRCRLANSYLYDKEIIPRVRQAVLADGRFTNTSIWVLGQRRWVWLKGCVSSRKQSAAIEQLVRGIDDVEQVVNQLMVGTEGKPKYELRDK